MTNTGETGDAGHGEPRPLSPEQRLLAGKVRVAGLALLFEKLWPRVWLPLGIAGVFVLVSIFELWQYLPPRVHFGVLCVFVAAFVASLVPLFLWRWPSRKAALARLERASALDHRPLTAYNDTLVQENPSPETAALWEAHRARAAQALKDLRAGAPHARIDKYDPFALRAALLLMLIAAAAWAWDDTGSRLRAAFTVPEFPAGSGFRIDAWISPPPYTKREPFVLAAASQAKTPVAVPQGSLLTVKINGPDAAGYSVTLEDGKKAQALEPAAESSGTYAEFTQKIERPVTLTVRRSFGAERSWVLNVIPDLPPKIAFVGRVEVTPRGLIILRYKAEDDYGVATAEARIERIAPGAEGSGPVQAVPQIGQPPVFPLSLPRPATRFADGKTYRDLTAHPWAGLPVVITLVARDEAGHEGFSAARGMILPERKFTKPLAKAVAGERRSLVENPADAHRIAANLQAIAAAAAGEGLGAEIYLNLRSASMRLRSRKAAEDVEAIAEQLWDVALRIEDGNLSAAERELRAAQDRLKDALEAGASPEELQKLMAELRQALNAYLQALMQQKGKQNGGSQHGNAKTVTPQQLQQLLNRIEGMAKAGSPEAAAQMLNELRDILESLQENQNGESAEDAERMRQLSQITGMMRQQQQLLDKTFRAQQGGGDAGQGEDQKSKPDGDRGQDQGGNSDLEALQQQQAALQKQLQDLLDEMKGGDAEAIRRKLKEGEHAMGDAAGALGQNDLGEAGDQQGRALEALRQGSRAMAEQMSRPGNQGRGAGEANNRDPLGRQNDSGDSVKVPDEITVQEARKILEELRKRLGERSRPPAEIEYLERLVKPY
jgi:uncharacterized protein (TIGR02302 family)